MGEINYEVKNNVGYVTISRENKMNSITKTMAEQMQLLTKKINRDETVRVVVLSGAGERSFSTGSDINLIHQYGTPWELRNREDYCSAIRQIIKPVIAKIKGYALGGGLELVLASDIRVATEDSKFAASEVKHGWIAGSGLVQILARNIGYPKAARFVLTAEMINGIQAKELGFITDIVDKQEIDAYVGSLAEKMTVLSPVALQLAKADLVASQNMTLDEGLKYENDLFAFSFTTKDSQEGLKAFKEKREPDFS